MKYVYMCGGYAAPEGGVYRAKVADAMYRAEHPDYICLQFQGFPGQPRITCHKDVVFDSKGDALLLAIQRTDETIKAKLEELEKEAHELQGLIQARARFFEDYQKTRRQHD